MHTWHNHSLYLRMPVYDHKVTIGGTYSKYDDEIYLTDHHATQKNFL